MECLIWTTKQALTLGYKEEYWYPETLNYVVYPSGIFDPDVKYVAELGEN